MSWLNACSSIIGQEELLLPERGHAAADVPGDPLGVGDWRRAHNAWRQAQRRGFHLDLAIGHGSHHGNPRSLMPTKVLNTRAGSTPNASAASRPKLLDAGLVLEVVDLVRDTGAFQLYEAGFPLRCPSWPSPDLGRRRRLG
ncbi:MAG: hypothetical protein R2705_20410 [Ilumatobacteraceae bacterium]